MRAVRIHHRTTELAAAPLLVCGPEPMNRTGGRLVSATRLLVRSMTLLRWRFVVVDFAASGWELVDCLMPVQVKPAIGRGGDPAGILLNGVPAMAPEGAPPGSPVPGDPIRALDGAPPGSPVKGNPIMALVASCLKLKDTRGGV